MPESFWPTLKTKFYDQKNWAALADTSMALPRWIEIVYNRRCRHSALRMVSPVDFKAQLNAQRRKKNGCLTTDPQFVANPSPSACRLQGAGCCRQRPNLLYELEVLCADHIQRAMSGLHPGGMTRNPYQNTRTALSAEGLKLLPWFSIRIITINHPIA